MRLLSINEEIFINQFSQGLFTIEQINDWFQSYDFSNKKDILYNLLNMVIQAHPTYYDIESSAISLGKIMSPSAIKLINKNKPFNKFGHEICNLPENELKIAFDILLLTLSKADFRKKNMENKDECNHWWHKDLSDEDYLQKLREDYLV